MAIQVGWAREDAHGQRRVRRDLKSPKMLLEQDGQAGAGRALVTDLGLARPLRARGFDEVGLVADAEEAALWMTVPAAGGTPTHVAPEQWASARHVGMASDVYGFGVMLYEIFCRQLLFEDETDWRGWQQAHVQGEVPDPRRWNKEIPAALAELLGQSLARKPADRPRGFRELE